MPSGIDIPLHWNAQHKVDRYGSPWEMFPWSFLASGSNMLIALCYAFINKLFDRGLVHGVSRKTARPFLCSVAIVILALWIFVLVIWIYQVQQAGF